MSPRSVYLRQLMPGVYVGRDVVMTLEDRCRALTLVLDDPCFSHHTALGLLGVDLPKPLEEDPALHVLVTERHARRMRKGTAIHFSARPLITRRVNGLTVVSPERAWLDTVSDLPLGEAVVLTDGLLRRQNPISTLDALHAEVDSAKGVRGLRKAREALDRARLNTDSPMETRTRLLMINNGLPCPAVNPEIRTDDGLFLGYADMAYLERKVIVEFDGEHHRTDRSTWQNDIRRTRQFELHGWRRIQVASHDIFIDPRPFLARVRQALSE